MVESSPRPKTRSKDRELQSGGLDVEFRADLEKQLKDNPIARLGYEGDVKMLPEEKTYTGASGPYTSAWSIPDITDRGIDQSRLDAMLKSEIDNKIKTKRSDVDFGDILLGAGGANNPTISHEMTHRGIDRLQKAFNEKPDYWIEKYGEGLVDALFRRDKKRTEQLTEFFDDTETDFILTDANRNSAKGNLKATQEYVPDSKTIEEATALAAMAEEVLDMQGEPEKAKKKEQGFWQKLFGRKYNKGGVVKKQLEFNFEEGGMIDENLERDPVSGNEIPPGSLAKEVRDDIPARLSEGEYVLPANVVQFYGLSTIEKMVQQAEEGLDKMEDDGRIGGEPADDYEEMEMAKGGVVMGDVVVFNEGGLAAKDFTTPGPVPTSTPGSSQFNQPTMMGDLTFSGGAPKFEGDVGDWKAADFTVPSVTPDSFKGSMPGFSMFGPTATGGGNTAGADISQMEFRTYQNDRGEIKVIPFKDGEPMQPIPEGFRPQADVVATPEEYVEQEVDDSDLMNELGRDPKDEATSYAEMTAEQLIRGANVGLTAGNMLEKRGIAAVAGLIGGPMIGLVGQGINKMFGGENLNIGVASALANAEIARARGDLAAAEEIEASVIENSQYTSMEELRKNTKLTARAERIAKNRGVESIKPKETKTPSDSGSSSYQTPSQRGAYDDGVERGAGSERADERGREAASEPDRSFGGGVESPSTSSVGSSAPDVSFSKETSKPSTSSFKGDTVDTSGGPGGWSSGSEPSEPDEFEGGWSKGTGSFKKGGLVTKRKRKTQPKQTKGLATRRKAAPSKG